MALETAGGFIQSMRSLPAGTAIKMAPATVPGSVGAGAAAAAGGGAGVTGAAGGGGAVGAAGAGGVGSVAGAVAAGAAAFGTGFVIGSVVADKVGIKYPGGKNAWEYFTGNLFNQGIGASDTSAAGGIITTVEGEPPFEGGQTPGVEYRGVLQVYEARFGDYDPPFLYTDPLTGPIVEFQFTSSGSFIQCYIKNEAGQLAFVEYQSGNRWQDKRTDFYEFVEIQHFSLIRADGQPDTGGNPPGDPETKKVSPPAGPLTRPQNPTLPAEPPQREEAPKAPPLPPPEVEPVNPETPTELEPGLDIKPWEYGLPMPAGAPLPNAGPSGNTTPVNPPAPDPNAPTGGVKAPPKTKPDCSCNPPIFNAIDNLRRWISNNLGNVLGLGGEAASTAAILAELATIKSGIGVQGLPATVPGNLANPKSGTRSLGSLAEMHLWQTEQIDGLLGQFPNKTTVQTAAGPVDMDLPNVGESLSEMMGMLMGLTVTSSQILHTSSRALHQAGSATQQAHLAGLYSKANADFLGYSGKQQAVDIPLAYSPGKDPWEGFLNEGSQKIKGWENDDQQDLKAILIELLHAAQIIRAVYWRKLDARGDFKQQVDQNIRSQSQYIDEETNRKATSSDWEQYLNRVEQGFSQETGDQTPYGRDPSESPKIIDRSANDDD